MKEFIKDMPQNPSNPLSLLANLLKKESILIDPNSLQAYVLLDKEGNKIDLSKEENQQSLIKILSKDQSSLTDIEKEQRNNLLQNSSIKLLDQANLIEEVSKSITNQTEKLTTVKRLQSFLGIADYARNLAYSNPEQYQILNQIIANQQLAIDDQGQALVSIKDTDIEEQEQKELLYPLRQYLDIQQEFNQQLESIKESTNPNTKTTRSLTSLLAEPTLNFIANPTSALKTFGALVFDAATFLASSLGNTNPAISNLDKQDQAKSKTDQLRSTAANNLAKPASWLKDDKPRNPYRVKVDIEKFRAFQKFNTQEQQEFSDDKYVTREWLEKNNHPGITLLNDNVNDPYENVDDSKPVPKYPNGVNLLFISDQGRCEEVYRYQPEKDENENPIYPPIFTIKQAELARMHKMVEDAIDGQANVNFFTDPNHPDINSRPLFVINFCGLATKYYDSAYATSFRLVKDEDNYIRVLNGYDYKTGHYDNFTEIRNLSNNIFFTTGYDRKGYVSNLNNQAFCDITCSINFAAPHEIGHLIGLYHPAAGYKQTPNERIGYKKMPGDIDFTGSNMATRMEIDQRLASLQYFLLNGKQFYGVADIATLTLIYGPGPKAGKELATTAMGIKSENQTLFRNVDFSGNNVTEDGLECIRVYFTDSLREIEPVPGVRGTYAEYVFNNTQDPDTRRKETERMWKCKIFVYENDNKTEIATITGTETQSQTVTNSITPTSEPTQTQTQTLSVTDNSITITYTNSPTDTNTVTVTNTNSSSPTATVTTTDHRTGTITNSQTLSPEQTKTITELLSKSKEQDNQTLGQNITKVIESITKSLSETQTSSITPTQTETISVTDSNTKSNQEQPASQNQDKMSDAAIAGISVASVVGIAAFAAAIGVHLYKQRAKFEVIDLEMQGVGAPNNDQPLHKNLHKNLQEVMKKKEVNQSSSSSAFPSKQPEPKEATSPKGKGRADNQDNLI